MYSKELFAGDKKEGTAFFYFPDGKIQQTLSYNNGKKEGLVKRAGQKRNSNNIAGIQQRFPDKPGKN